MADGQLGQWEMREDGEKGKRRGKISVYQGRHRSWRKAGGEEGVADNLGIDLERSRSRIV